MGDKVELYKRFKYFHDAFMGDNGEVTLSTKYYENFGVVEPKSIDENFHFWRDFGCIELVITPYGCEDYFKLTEKGEAYLDLANL